MESFGPTPANRLDHSFDSIYLDRMGGAHLLGSILFSRPVDSKRATDYNFGTSVTLINNL